MRANFAFFLEPLFSLGRKLAAAFLFLELHLKRFDCFLFPKSASQTNFWNYVRSWSTDKQRSTFTSKFSPMSETCSHIYEHHEAVAQPNAAHNTSTSFIRSLRICSTTSALPHHSILSPTRQHFLSAFTHPRNCLRVCQPRQDPGLLRLRLRLPADDDHSCLPAWWRASLALPRSYNPPICFYLIFFLCFALETPCLMSF